MTHKPKPNLPIQRRSLFSQCSTVQPNWTQLILALSCTCLLVCPVLVSCESSNSSESRSSAGNNALSVCVRCTTGESVHSLVLRPPKPNCASGHFFPVILNRTNRCECDYVCASGSQQVCWLPSNLNNTRIPNQSLCDSTLNLKCNPQLALCEGPLRLSISHIRPQSFYVNWIGNIESSSQVSDSTRIAIAKYTSPVVNQTNFLTIKTYITKNESNKLSAKVESLQENTTYIVKIVDNGKEELSIVTTSENTIEETLPKVLVTVRNSSSISIAFDDFKPVNYNRGYGVKYRSLIANNSSRQTNLWTTIPANNTPFYVLSDLKPSTQYQIQVFTWDNSGEQIHSHSEIVNVSTADGCVHHNRTFEVGDKVVVDCDQICLCQADGSLLCTERCSPPLMTVEMVKNKHLQCTAIPNDECCVRCNPAIPNPTTSSSTKKFIDKPGECGQVNGSANESAFSAVTCSSDDRKSECTHDYHCTGIKKCCADKCGHLRCVEPTNSSVHLSTKCPFKCGPNAVCVFSEEEGSYRCACADRFEGDDPVRGCVPSVPSRLHQCTFHDGRYSIGQTFVHACEMCVCTEALEVECRPKCPSLNQSSLPPHCKVVPDPSDPVCCQQSICDSTSPHTPNIAKFPHHHNQSVARNGCMHLGQLYHVNESFYLECELKCLCKTTGEIECVPRCYNDPGYDENFCYLVEDPDDPECCKISICDTQHNSSEPLPGLIIEMAEAINSTSLKMRMIMNASSVPSNEYTIFYSKMFPNESGQNDHFHMNRSWVSLVVSNETLRIISNLSAEMTLTQLQPETDYLLYLSASQDNMTSNKVFVRTYPQGINHTFNGCFNGTKFFEVGQVFEEKEKECDEFRCVCREGGIRECEERCPKYVDLIGYENCQWKNSTEDPCCSVPVNCAETNESSSAHSVPQQYCFNEGKQMQLGDSWTVGTDCLQKQCHCIETEDGEGVEVKCTGGCPTITERMMQPNDLCRSPKVIQPLGPCMCPYVVCDHNLNPLDLPEKNVQKKENGSCLFRGDKIAVGKEFYDNCRAICRCEPGAVLDCKPIQCSQTFGPHTTKCLEWDIDPHFIPVAPNCCPEPKCKNDGSCLYAGIRFGNFKNIPQELLPCGKRCVCNGGQINCENLCPEVSDKPPLGLPCPESNAFRGHLPGDKCCIHWQCKDVYSDRIKGNCMYKDKRFKLGEQWDENDTGLKRRCQCKTTNGIMHVACNPGNCQPITERFLQASADCTTPTVVVPNDPVMCPYVVCNSSSKADGSSELENVDIVAINATSARIRFTIPHLYVGLLGHAEVHYTTDMNTARVQWNIQKFARPKRMFDIPNIEYHLGNLKPDTTYYLQIEVVIEALKTGPSSEIFKLYQPPLPVSVSTTTTTTTSTLPPIIMLDMHLTAQALDATSAKVLWRPFSTQERKFIDGIQLRYKKTDASEEQWSYSGLLHRDTKQYVLDGLESGASYAVDLMFISLDGIATNIVSTKPVVVELPAPPKDEFQFTPHIHPVDVTINEGAIEVEVRNLPRPLSKFVNLVKLCYQNMQSSQLMFDYLNSDESTTKFLFSNLLSNTRYKIWIDFYLTNGQVVTTNSIDIITKFNKERALEENDTGALTSGHLVESKYLLAFMVISVFVFATGAGFMVVTCIFMRKHSTAAISRVCISEAAYDNPTYKTFEATEKCAMDDSLSKSSTIPPK